jgi:hypothetical protein
MIGTCVRLKFPHWSISTFVVFTFAHCQRSIADTVAGFFVEEVNPVAQECK